MLEDFKNVNACSRESLHIRFDIGDIIRLVKLQYSLFNIYERKGVFNEALRQLSLILIILPDKYEKIRNMTMKLIKDLFKKSGLKEIEISYNDERYKLKYSQNTVELERLNLEY